LKILIVADWHGEIYAQAFCDGFKNLGYDTFKFSWKEYFKHYQYSTRYETDGNKLKSLYYKIQNKFLIGPALWKINKDLIEQCEDIKPDLIFIYRGTHIYPKTIQKLKESFGCKVYGYNNDDPFSLEYKSYVWRCYKKSIPLYDHIFAYRWKNIDDYKAIGYDYYFDMKNDNLFYKDQSVKLSTKEKLFLKLLIESSGTIVPFGTLESHIWPNSNVSDSTFRTLVYRLRSKLEFKLIETIPSFGYRLNI